MDSISVQLQHIYSQILECIVSLSSHLMQEHPWLGQSTSNQKYLSYVQVDYSRNKDNCKSLVVNCPFKFCCYTVCVRVVTLCCYIMCVCVVTLNSVEFCKGNHE